MKKIILSIAALALGSAAFSQTSAGSIMLGGNLGFSSAGGKTEVSGSPVAAQNGSVDAPTSGTFNFSPSGAYFIQDNLALGLSINFGSGANITKRSYNKTTGTVSTPGIGFTPGANDVAFDDETKTSSLGLTLYANKFNDLTDKWKWYYGAQLGFTSTGGTGTFVRETTPGSGAWTTKEEDAPKGTNIGLGINMGVTYFLTENWAFFGGLNNLLALNLATTKAETVVAPITTTTTTNNLSLSAGTGSFGSGTVTFGVFYFLGN